TAILVVCIGIWCLAMGVAAAAMSFAVLFAARITLGVLSAAGGPPVTSLVGDLFPADVRGRGLPGGRCRGLADVVARRVRGPRGHGHRGRLRGRAHTRATPRW